MARLAFLIANLGGGGAERVAIALIRGFVERGHEVDLLLMRQEGELFELLPPSVRVFNLKSKRIRNVFRPLIHYLRNRRPAAIQVSMWPLTVAAIVAARLARVPVRVVTSDHSNLSRQYGGSAMTMAALKASTRLLYPLADARIAVSAGSADDLAQLSRIRRTDFEVIYNPIPAPPRPLETNRSVERMWGGGGTRILTVGSLKDPKNHALLIQAFAKLVKGHPAKLMILGEGELRGELESLARSLGIADRVLMPGFVVDPWPFYASAEIFILSSNYEGFGNVIVEALHAGLPVISTDCAAGPAEILENGEYGTLVLCNDAHALASAMASAMAISPQPERQKARAKFFSEDAAVEKYLDLMLERSNRE